MDHGTITRVATLFEAFAAGNLGMAMLAGKLVFAGVNGADVYNITAPFLSAGRRVVAGRVEARESEESTAVFFEERDGVWHPIHGAPRLRLQDPFVTRIGEELVFGGVETAEADGTLTWWTNFYRGSDIFDLQPFFTGPPGMKDIRLCELADGRIGVFTRPRGRKGGRGTIGYTEVASLDALTVEAIHQAPLLEGMFHPLDWGGANEVHLLSSGELGVIAHAACYVDDILYGVRRYYAVAFVFDPAGRQWRDYRIIAARDQFAPGPAKRPDLIDVVFSSGIECTSLGTRLYAGTSDAEAQWLDIAYPFDVPLAKAGAGAPSTWSRGVGSGQSREPALPD